MAIVTIVGLYIALIVWYARRRAARNQSRLERRS